MKKVSIVVHKNYLEELVKKLHESGYMQIDDISKEEPKILSELEKSSMHPEAGVCANYELRLSRLIDILSKVKKKEKGIKSLLNPTKIDPQKIDSIDIEELYSAIETNLAEIEKTIIEEDQKIQDIKEKIIEINQTISKLKYIEDFDFDLSTLQENEYFFIKIGKTTDLEKLNLGLRNIQRSDIYSKQFGSGKKAEWSVLIVYHVSEKDKIEKLCRENLIEFDLNQMQGSPKENLNSLNNEIKNLKKQKKQIISKLQKYSKQKLFDLQVLKEQIQVEKIRREISKNFAKTNSTYLINGWALEKNEEKLKNAIEQSSRNKVIYNSKEPSVNPDDPPTYLDTPKWADGFRGLLSMFALPKYNEINPTIIMGIFFVLFFGVMLGDAGYGAIILLLSLLGYFKFGKHSSMIKSWSFMGFWMGLITTIVGILTYSIFGDLVHRFILNLSESAPPAYKFGLFGIEFPVQSLDDPLSILTVALVLGLIHLNVGVFLGVFQAFKQKKYKEMITEKFCWVLLQLGGGMLIGQFILGWNLVQPMFYAAAIMVVIGIILLFIAAGPVGFFDITGYVGDWLSYARLLALGLATAGMALAFNVVAGLLGDMVNEMIPILGTILLIIILVFAHMVNLALQALGAGVHSLRLQYVEFFNRFYEGGGKEFSPFKIKRKYTKLKEEN